MRLRAYTIALLLGSGACGSEESFEPQLASRERLLDTSAAAQIDADNETIEGITVVGDLDGDGIDDAVIRTGFAFDYPDGLLELDSHTYVLYGGEGFQGKRALKDLPRLIGAWELGGATTVAAAGDVDGDGLADVLVTAARSMLCAGNEAPEGDGLRTGAYLVYGDRTRLAGDVAIGRVSTFFRDPVPCTITGVADLGDLDGDGKADFAVTRGPMILPAATEALAFYGRAARWPAVVDLVATADARIGGSWQNGFIPGFAKLGDVDGDGYADFLVRDAVPFAKDLRLVRGSATRLAGAVDASTLGQTTFIAAAPCRGLGVPLGDLDGDGADDFALQDCHGDVRDLSITLTQRVFYGRKAGFPAQLGVADGDAVVVLDNHGGATTGVSGIAGGDVDGDGVPDLVVGDRHLRDEVGGVHVVPGNGTRLAGTVDLAQRGLTYVSRPRRAKNCDFAPAGCIVREQAGADVSLGDLTGDHRLDLLVQADATAGLVPRDVAHSSQDRVYIVAGTNP